MGNDSPIRMQVAITLLPKLNSRLYLEFIEKCGGIEGFFYEKEKALHLLYKEFNIKGEKPFDRKTALERAAHELEEMDRHNISLCTVEHHTYPPLLTHCEDAPLAFYYKGKLTTHFGIYLAIVGTRRASERCRSHIDTLLKELSESGHPFTIVSGLAFGIDASAHQASLKYNISTYAVLGHGLHMIYPASHKHMADKILEQGGALISEFPCCASTLPVNFLQRNRVIAGLCHATLIAESAEKGGAMTTAHLAHSYNREVMAFPGRPEDKLSAGCNRLIKQNIAALVENGSDILQLLGIKAPKPKPLSLPHFFEAADNESILLKTLTENAGMNIDDLSVYTHISIDELSALLLKLELEEKIISLPGKNYIIK